MLGYRYNTQIFDQMTNAYGKKVTDYDDQENTVIFKAIPIMDVNSIKDTFFDSFGDGNFQGGRQFGKGNCVVDLNPDKEEYGQSLADGKFPMRFLSSVDVQNNEYKTSKMVLSRIDGISGGKSDVFTMGSKDTDYDMITNEAKVKFSDQESVLGESP